MSNPNPPPVGHEDHHDITSHNSRLGLVLFFIYLLLYGVLRLALDPLRADGRPERLLGLSPQQGLALAVIGVRILVQVADAVAVAARAGDGGGDGGIHIRHGRASLRVGIQRGELGAHHVGIHEGVVLGEGGVEGHGRWI